MRVKKEKKPVEVVCVDCGHTFTAFSIRALRCAECKEENLRRVKATKQAKYRSEAYARSKARKNVPSISITEVIKAMEKYNKKHGTRLSYGPYVQKMESGEV